RLRRHQLRLVPLDRDERLPRGPDGPAHGQQVPAEALDMRDEDAALRRDALGLELVQSLAEVLEDREVAVHHRVDERIGEVVRAGGPEPAATRANAAAHALED